jgi:hypothetical protein
VARLANAFDGDDLVVLVRHGECQACIDSPPVDQHGAGAALAAVASILGAWQAGVFTQRIKQRDAWLDHQFAALAVDTQHDMPLPHGRRGGRGG